MSNSINQVNYDALTQIAKQLHSESEDHAQLNAQTRQRMDALQGGWQGDAAKAFFNEMNGELLPASQRLVAALQSGESVLNQIMQIIHQADEETASYFKGFGGEIIAAGGKAALGTSSGFAFPNWTKEDLMKWAQRGGELLQDVLILKALKNGEAFSSQVKVYGSNLYLKYVLGLDEFGRSMKGGTLINNIVEDSLKITRWNVFFTGVKLAADFIPDYFKYSDAPHRSAAFSADALIAASSLQAFAYGAGQGAIVGGIIGSAVPVLGTGVGAAVGGLIGGLSASWGTEHVLTTPFKDLIPQIGSVAGGAVGNGIIPGFGMIAGSQFGGQGGQMITGLISPDITKLSIKDIFIEGTVGFGNFIAN